MNFHIVRIMAGVSLSFEKLCRLICRALRSVTHLMDWLRQEYRVNEWHRTPYLLVENTPGVGTRVAERRGGEYFSLKYARGRSIPLITVSRFPLQFLFPPSLPHLANPIYSRQRIAREIGLIFVKAPRARLFATRHPNVGTLWKILCVIA